MPQIVLSKYAIVASEYAIVAFRPFPEKARKNKKIDDIFCIFFWKREIFFVLLQ